MDTKKMSLIATIVVIALLAAGIGYAYTASVSTSDNTVTTKYMVVTTLDDDGQEDYTASLKDLGLKLDTVNDEGTITYKLATTGNSDVFYIKEGALVSSETQGATAIYKIGTQKIRLDATNFDSTEFNNGAKNIYAKMSFSSGNAATTGFTVYYSINETTGSKAAEIGDALGSTSINFTVTPNETDNSKVNAVANPVVITLYATVSTGAGAPTGDASDMKILDGVSFDIVASTESIS